MFTNKLYRKHVVRFTNIQEYITNYTSSGDWIIPLTADIDGTFEKYDNDKEAYPIDDINHMNSYDPKLMRIYRKQDENIVLKNVKRLGTKDPKQKGLVGKISSIFEKDIGIASVIEKQIFKNIVSIYDKFMIDNFTNNVLEIHIWVPLWRTKSIDAVVITFIDRVHLILT